MTVHALGRGKVYYLATRVREPFYEPFYAQVAKAAGVERALESKLPTGVMVHASTDGESDYVFVMNFSGLAQDIRLDDRRYTDLETGEALGPVLALDANGVLVLKR